MSTTDRPTPTPGFYTVPPGTEVTVCPTCNRKVYCVGPGRILHVLSAKVVDGHTVAREHRKCCPGIKSACPDPNAPSQVGEWDMYWISPHAKAKVKPCRRCKKDVTQLRGQVPLLDVERQEQWGEDFHGHPNMQAPPHYQFCEGAK